LQTATAYYIAGAFAECRHMTACAFRLDPRAALHPGIARHPLSGCPPASIANCARETQGSMSGNRTIPSALYMRGSQYAEND
jgi:hypothetical protein